MFYSDKITHLAPMKSYLVIIFPHLYNNLTKSVIRLSLNRWNFASAHEFIFKNVRNYIKINMKLIIKEILTPLPHLNPKIHIGTTGMYTTACQMVHHCTGLGTYVHLWEINYEFNIGLLWLWNIDIPNAPLPKEEKHPFLGESLVCRVTIRTIQCISVESTCLSQNTSQHVSAYGEGISPFDFIPLT